MGNHCVSFKLHYRFITFLNGDHDLALGFWRTQQSGGALRSKSSVGWVYKNTQGRFLGV